MARAPSFILTAVPSDVSRVFRACTYSLNCACGLIFSSVVTAFLKDSSALAMSSRFWTNGSNVVLKSVKMQSNSEMSSFLKSRSFSTFFFSGLVPFSPELAACSTEFVPLALDYASGLFFWLLGLVWTSGTTFSSAERLLSILLMLWLSKSEFPSSQFWVIHRQKTKQNKTLTEKNIAKVITKSKKKCMHLKGGEKSAEMVRVTQN